MKVRVLLILAIFTSLPAFGGEITSQQTDVINQLLATYAEQAKVEPETARTTRGLKEWDKPFSAEAGRQFYLKRRSWSERDYSCSNCHTTDPRNEGTHIITKQPIKPLAPSANPERFIDASKVEKNFSEHCFDFYKRDCHAYEKGNFITYLMSVK